MLMNVITFTTNHGSSMVKIAFVDNDDLYRRLTGSTFAEWSRLFIQVT
jgi:hypothetical protein